MPRLWHLLRDKSLAISIIVAGALRLLSATHSYGWFTRDDYQLGIEQAYALLHQPWLSFSEPIRSPVLTWGCAAFFTLGEALGLHDRVALVRFSYACWGLFSLLAIPRVHAIARRTFGDAVAAIAAFLMAAYAIMPAISCRAMIEVVAIVPLAWAMDDLDRARQRGGFGLALRGALFLALATLVRFQLGLLFIAAAWALRHANRQALLGLALGAAVGAAAQCGIDTALGREILATPWAYVRFNLTYASTYGTSPWYTYLLHFVLLTVPPATLAFLGPMRRAMRRQPFLCAMLVVFVGVHSVVGHKEDRFMFSMLPAFFILLASALHQAWHGRPWQRALVWVFIGVNAVGLGVTTLSDTHRSVNAPLVHLGRHAPYARVASVGFATLPTYYLGEHAQLHGFGDVGAWQAQLSAAPHASMPWDYVWLRGPDLAGQIAQVAEASQSRCREVTYFHGDFADRLLVRVNRHNARRGPTALVRCESIANGYPL